MTATVMEFPTGDVHASKVRLWPAVPIPAMAFVNVASALVRTERIPSAKAQYSQPGGTVRRRKTMTVMADPTTSSIAPAPASSVIFRRVELIPAGMAMDPAAPGSSSANRERITLRAGLAPVLAPSVQPRQIHARALVTMPIAMERETVAANALRVKEIALVVRTPMRPSAMSEDNVRRVNRMPIVRS